MSASWKLNRRSMLKAGVASLASLSSRSVSALAKGSGDVCGAVPKTATGRPEQAVSLREVAKALGDGREVRLERLTRLDGYIVDRENRDVVIWGLSERDQPELHVEDLIVALRSAYGRYAARRDGVDYIATPLVSIDPNVEILRQIREINLLSRGGKERFSEICGSPQTVRVEGMPHNSRVAKVLIDADYRMKMVAQGTVKLPITTPFPSSFNARVARWREHAADHQSSEMINTRYWFEPGKFSYRVSAESDTVLLDCPQVVLNDEDQFVSREGLVASGKVDQISRAFACAWTERMEDTYRAEPIWRDMHNQFRNFAIARIMRDRDAFSHADLSLEFLFERYELPGVKVPDVLAGLGRVEEYERAESDGGRMRFAYQVCGGVAVMFATPIEHLTDEGDARAFGRSVLKSRPSVPALAWNVRPATLQDIFQGVQPKAPAAPTPSRPSEKRSIKDLFNMYREGNRLTEPL
jgi:hypothetical protein